MLRYSAHEICQKKNYEKKNKISKTKKIKAKTQYLNVKAPIKQRQNAIR